MPTTALLEHEFGWWVLPRSPMAWRLSWSDMTRTLCLYEGGGRTFVIRLGKFATATEAAQRLAGWTEAPPVPGRQGLDAWWLTERFPALATYLRQRDAGVIS